MNVDIEQGWKTVLNDEFEKPYFGKLITAIYETYLGNEPIYPPKEFLFSAFNFCPFDSIKVVLIGQDPYHGAGQAHGLCFSVPDTIKIPPSLQNIYKELKEDIGKPIPTSGSLEHWAKQGVLLLNATLTVEHGKPGSHHKLGWEKFTDAVVQKISDEKEHVVFLLWGRYAREKGKNIDTRKHLVLHAPHPSPFSAYSGFFGCKHFSKTNAYLKQHGRSDIRW